MDDPHEPGRLSNEDIAVRIKAGDRDLIPVLWERVRRFIARTANYYIPYTRPGTEADDLVNTGYIALVKAVEYFEPDKGANFLTALKFYLRAEFGAACGWRTGKKDPILTAASLDRPLKDGDDRTLEDIQPSSRDEIGEAERRIWLSQLRRALSRAMDELPPDEREAFLRRFWKEQTTQDAAKAMGLSFYEFRKLEAAAKKTMRKNRELREYAEERRVDSLTPWFFRVSAEIQNSTGYSTVEKLAEIRESIRRGGPVHTDPHPHERSRNT